MESTTINNRTYTVEVANTPANAAADLIKRGWDGNFYMLTGKRGAAYIAFRTPSGQFSIVNSLR